MWTIHSKTVWQLMGTLLLFTGDAHSLLAMVLRQNGLKLEKLGMFPEASNDTTGILIAGFEPLPEEVWSSQDHILEVLQGQSPVLVSVCFIQHLLTDQGHFFSTQFPTGQPGHRLLQVPCTDVVVIVEVCEANRRGTPDSRRACLPPCLELYMDTHAELMQQLLGTY